MISQLLKNRNNDSTAEFVCYLTNTGQMGNNFMFYRKLFYFFHFVDKELSLLLLFALTKGRIVYILRKRSYLDKKIFIYNLHILFWGYVTAGIGLYRNWNFSFFLNSLRNQKSSNPNLKWHQINHYFVQSWKISLQLYLQYQLDLKIFFV